VLVIKVKVLVEKSNGFSTCDWYKEIEIHLSDDNISEISNAIIAVHPTNDGLIHADSESTPAVSSGLRKPLDPFLANIGT
jgi:hypothetical protein